MGHTLTNHLYHIVFTTKGRERLISPDVREELYKYMCGIARNSNGITLKINGTRNHVHLLAQVRPSISISDFVRLIKGNSSRWLSDRFAQLERFQWQAGYSSFSVSESKRKIVAAYIEKQEEHHRSHTFAEELARFLKKHGISFDPGHYLD